MNPKVINLTTAVSELRTERSAADAQRFELKLLMARLNIVDKQSAGILADIMGMHEGARSNLKDQAIVDTLLEITTKGAKITEAAQQRAAKVNSERI